MKFDIDQLYYAQPVWCKHENNKYMMVAFFNKKDPFFAECETIIPINQEQMKTMPNSFWDLYGEALEEIILC